ncbi:FAD-dependent monooxygenase [Glaciibacter sp. 2TAF33]|uniref:FAD-dependent monooxygenase n=1 Tax=Glaciibacter sp. 2TAF33 TaxID=3233015 RepID=UPI003F9150CF
MAGLDESTVDVLIVGAGPTGLALAAQLRALGVGFRIVDRATDAVHESRALAIQARTLEVLTPLGLGAELAAQGDAATVLLMHFANSTAEIPLFDEGFDETSFPYLLFLSQAKTERILADRLAQAGTPVERGVEFRTLAHDAGAVTSTLDTAAGEVVIRSRYVVGCDGAHSAVRHSSGIRFPGTAFPQSFVIADLEADALETGRVHVYLAADGMMFFFPLGSPATWRMLVMASPTAATEAPTLEAVQAIVGRYTTDPVVLRDPVWLTNFTVHSRRAESFRAGPVFLAGDAAHIHSPAGAQGMNTGIQDAVNLGWKLALVCQGLAGETVLDSYQSERLPVARSVLRMTDRAFRVATSRNPLFRWFRPRAAAVVVPMALRIRLLRRIGFLVVSQLGIGYRKSPLSVEGRPRLGRRARAGDRLPDSAITVNGHATTLHRSLPSGFCLLCCGPAGEWPEHVELGGPRPALVQVIRLSSAGGPGVWVDPTQQALRRMGLRPADTAQFLVRPDGYIGYRARGADLSGVRAYLESL